MHRWFRIPVFFFLFTVSTIGTVGAVSPATPSSNADLLMAGEQQWQQVGITHYRITVAEQTVWIAQTITLTVQDGTIVDQVVSCQRPVVRAGACLTSPLDDPRRVTALQTDPMGGYVSSIDTDMPHVDGIAYHLRVTDFVVLP